MEPRDSFADDDNAWYDRSMRYDGEPYDAPEPPVEGDAVEHLWNAAHEMLRAMRTLLDAADEFVESQRGPRSTARAREPASREGRVHHIDIDAS